MTAILDLPQVPAQTFTIKRNCEFTDGLIFEYADGTPISLVGISFYCQARDPTDPTGVNILLDASTDNGLFANGGANGSLRFALLETNTRTMTDTPGAPMDLIAVGDDDTGRTHIVGLMKDAPSTLIIAPGYTQVT